MAGPSGLQGLSGYVISQPEATPEDIQGGTVNPYHAQSGEQPEPYPWQAVPYGGDSYTVTGPESELVDAYGFAVLTAGSLDQNPVADHTPYTHDGPWPRDPIGDQSTRPDNTADQLMQSFVLHSRNTGAARAMQYSPTLVANNDTWQENWTVDPGTSTLQSNTVPHQIGASVAGFGSTDRIQSLAGQNSYGYDSAHVHRRFATGSIPGNYQYLQPGSRPLVRSLGGVLRNFPTGANTPFYGDDTSISYNIDGAILQDSPTEYAAPPEPNTVAPPTGDGGSMVGMGDLY
jgi:hypothetical protein